MIPQGLGVGTRSLQTRMGKSNEVERYNMHDIHVCSLFQQINQAQKFNTVVSASNVPIGL